jgi:cAMP-dependent protein kinase regulator
MEDQQRAAVIGAMRERSVAVDEFVIRQGEAGDCLYVIAEGAFDVLKNDAAVFSYRDTGMFGELALMYNCPRAASVRAASAGRLWALDRVAFRHLLVEHNARRSAVYEEFLAQVPVLAQARAVVGRTRQS